MAGRSEGASSGICAMSVRISPARHAGAREAIGEQEGGEIDRMVAVVAMNSEFPTEPVSEGLARKRSKLTSPTKSPSRFSTAFFNNAAPGIPRRWTSWRASRSRARRRARGFCWSRSGRTAASATGRPRCSRRVSTASWCTPRPMTTRIWRRCCSGTFPSSSWTSRRTSQERRGCASTIGRQWPSSPGM